MAGRCSALYLSSDSASAQIPIMRLGCDVAQTRDSKFKYTALTFIDSETFRLHVAEEFMIGRGATYACADYMNK
jgi:hypothetical protein